MSRTTMLAAGCLAATVALSGCGGSSTDAYCETIKSSQAELRSVSASASSDQVAKTADVLRSIADKAPEASKAGWQTLADKVDALQQALDAAGLTLGDLSDATKLQDADPADVKAVQAALSGFADAADTQAKLNEEVQKDCNITLGTGAGQAPSSAK